MGCSHGTVSLEAAKRHKMVISRLPLARSRRPVRLRRRGGLIVLGIDAADVAGRPGTAHPSLVFLGALHLARDMRWHLGQALARRRRWCRRGGLVVRGLLLFLHDFCYAAFAFRYCRSRKSLAALTTSASLSSITMCAAPGMTIFSPWGVAAAMRSCTSAVS